MWRSLGLSPFRTAFRTAQDRNGAKFRTALTSKGQNHDRRGRGAAVDMLSAVALLVVRRSALRDFAPSGIRRRLEFSAVRDSAPFAISCPFDLARLRARSRSFRAHRGQAALTGPSIS